MKKLTCIVAAIALCALCMGLVVGCGGSSSATGSSSKKSSSTTATFTSKATGDYAAGTHHAVVKVTGYGEFTITLDADSAPVSVANFCQLANDGYYNGLKFYRIVDGFCLQGGTKGNSASGQDESLTPVIGEFSDNDVENPLAEHFERGTVALARTGVMNSAKSTFFITLATTENVSKSLDGQYAAFGTIDESGMKIIDSIVSNYLKYAKGNGGAITDSNNMPVIESITITD